MPLLLGLIEQRDSLPLLELLTLVGEWPVAYTDWNLTKGNTCTSCFAEFAFKFP